MADRGRGVWKPPIGSTGGSLANKPAVRVVAWVAECKDQR